MSDGVQTHQSRVLSVIQTPQQFADKYEGCVFGVHLFTRSKLRNWAAFCLDILAI
jgi:hypothetical protein